MLKIGLSATFLQYTMDMVVHNALIFSRIIFINLSFNKKVFRRIQLKLLPLLVLKLKDNSYRWFNKICTIEHLIKLPNEIIAKIEVKSVQKK